MGYSSAVRIAVSQGVLFAILTYTFVLLGVSLNEDGRHYRFMRRALFVVAGCFAYPFLTSFILLYGILKDKMILVRAWLISSITVTIMLLFLLLSGAIYMSVRLDIYWGIILCGMPFVLTLWMAEGHIVVSSYYNKWEMKTKNTISA